MCNKVDGIFSWQGQASLGGYIGDDFGSFFSSVISCAAGTYIATLHENQVTCTWTWSSNRGRWWSSVATARWPQRPPGAGFDLAHTMAGCW